MLNLLGCNKENFKKLLQKMGYHFIEKEKDLFFKYKGVKNSKKINKKETNKESPFKVLKQLNLN